MSEPVVGRRTLLLSAGATAAGGLSACSGSSGPSSPRSSTSPRSGVSGALPGTSPASPSEEPAILTLSFDVETRYRPFAIVAPGFITVSRRGRSAGAAPAFKALELSETGPPAPFAGVEVDVTALSGTVVAGLATRDNEHLLGFYDRKRRRAGIELRLAGTMRVLAQTQVSLPESFSFAMALCENQLTVLADTGDGWRPLLTERDEVAAAVDMRVPETLGAYRYAWGLRASSGPHAQSPPPTAELSAVRAGLFGMTGLRDLHLVQHSDGTPYVDDGKVHLTATCAGLGFFQQAHCGVFTLELANPTKLEQVSQLFSLRDGLLLGDHAGQVVRDDDNDRWIVAVSSWGSFDGSGVHVRHVVTTDDVLSGIHVLETVPTALPTKLSAWDPAMTRIDGRWHVGFVESPSQDPFDFHPALAAGPERGEPSSTDAFDDDLELVGAASDLTQCEGPILARVEGDWWLLASDGADRSYPVFDMTMTQVGRLDAPYETNIPHPQIVPLDGAGKDGAGGGGDRDDGELVMVTFDGTQFAEDVMGYGGHGDVLILREKGS